MSDYWHQFEHHPDCDAIDDPEHSTCVGGPEGRCAAYDDGPDPAAVVPPESPEQP